MASAKEIRHRLQRQCPPRVPREDVEALLDAHLPGRWNSARTGSHDYIIEHEWLWPPLFAARGILSLPVTGGREVKKAYVEKLLKFLDVLDAGRAAGADESRRVQ